MDFEIYRLLKMLVNDGYALDVTKERLHSLVDEVSWVFSR